MDFPISSWPFRPHLTPMMTHRAFSFSPLMIVRGAAPGPRLIVTGTRHVMEPLANRLWLLPGLPDILGTLILREAPQPALFDLPDNILNLMDDSESAYRRTLDRMTTLGMISGCGLPLRWVA